MIRFLKDLILRILQIPANFVAALVMEHPAISAKFFPYYNRSVFYVLPKTEIDPASRDNGLAVPPKELWEGYGPTREEYLQLGREHIQKMKGILKAGGYEFSDGERILEFGCAAGRMTRWLKSEAERGEVWGTDINAEYILWAQQFLSPPFHFVTNTTLPHLAFPDGYFSLIYAGSVFSHVSDLADAWLLELGRILRPGGKLFVTICDNHTIELLMTKHADSSWANIIRPHVKKVRSLPRGFNMFSMRRSPTGAQVFYDVDFFARKLHPLFKVISVTPEGYGLQTGVLAEKRGESPIVRGPHP